ncbi:MAG: hypothetical protein DRP79_08820 [Planctomycetota bacterium]|nr:MAG: hypothetical protein DRP79_08820 [Planctomycetota bacterium]
MRNSRYRSSEIKAGIWIFISLVIFTGFMVSITGSRFWKEMDHYRVRLKYVGGLEIGSPVRMGGFLVGKISDVKFLPAAESGLELTLEVRKGLPIKENTVAYLSFISITSEQHLELEQNPEPAPLLSPGDLIPSKELTTMDDVMEQIGYVGDTLRVILSRVHLLLKPENIARVDSIIAGIIGLIQENSSEVTALLASARRSMEEIDTLINSLDHIVDVNDTLLTRLLAQTREAVDQATATMAGIHTTAENVDHLVLSNAGNLMRILDNLSRVTENLKEFSNTIKDNPFLLIRAISRKKRKLKQ